MIQQVPLATATEEQQSPVCCHHWVIQPATGPVSQGMCRNCGETREFMNYLEESSWGDEKTSSQAPATANPRVMSPRLYEESYAE